MKLAIQQFHLRAAVQTEPQAMESLRLMREAGFQGIELNGFMIRRMPFYVPLLTRLAGMPIGRSGRLDWKALIDESGLEVVGIHEDLGSILARPASIVAEARGFRAPRVVVPGMFRFDFSRQDRVMDLARRLNEAGQLLKAEGISLLYHNHNGEFRRVESGQHAYALIVDQTDAECVGLEYDAYWATEAGCDAAAWLDSLGGRVKMIHVSDRGTRLKGAAGAIVKGDSVELGQGNMNLPALFAAAQRNVVDTIVLETHRNWVDRSPVKSAQVSAAFLRRQVERLS